MAVRTTEEAVKGIIEVDEDIVLIPFIETANYIVNKVCLESDYEETDLELIERWLSAHFYAVREPRTSREEVKGITEQFAISVKSAGFNTIPYGQQALLIDVDGNLKELDEAKGKFEVGIFHIGGDPCTDPFLTGGGLLMKLLKKMLKGTAVYWEPTGINDSGDPEVGLPVQIKCRWEDSIEQGLDSSGTETTFKSTVYVDRIVEEGGMLMKGTLNDLKGNKPPKEAHRIRLFNIIPTIKYKESLKEVKL